MPKKTRVDLLLVARGLVESRSLAQRLVMAGQVRADGQLVDKPSSKVGEDVALQVERGPRFVSRGGEKLQAAFESFDLDVDGLICADLGASTGGFTDCLLQHGAAKVYAIDVGKGILHWKLRNDPRVVVMEGTNARFLEELPEPIDFVTIDASFIPLKILLPAVKGCGKGVVRDPKVHRQVLLDVLNFAEENDYQIKGLARSPVLGPKGNVEFLGWLGFNMEDDPSDVPVADLVSSVVGTDSHPHTHQQS
jgi:23S rRNA (cytidine1920-2'-O)/16S rRNA (cytidine1409-2'-O)-methyltransferase